ncbi:hypothetical protein H7I53_25175 [Mycolicibacterium pulveris]|nr:hypothetical protein [Mycolicibacterium pulveris]MCV6983496.1 hypothetical protein [Mycolicibacterium pulveris]
MTKTPTPSEAAAAVTRNATLPPGDDERFVGYGVMGLPFRSGHYLALRDFPATSFSPAYRSVWHRDPSGQWSFYATTPGQQSCSRYFRAATTQDAIQCDIDVAWLTPWSLLVQIAGLLDWTIELKTTPATRLMSGIGRRLPSWTWTNPSALAAIGRAAGPVLRSGQVRLSGLAPNGQRFMIAPTQLWAVARSCASWRGEDLGPTGPLDRQARLADFRPPQRGIFVVGSGHFESFDPARHRAAESTISIR